MRSGESEWYDAAKAGLSTGEPTKQRLHGRNMRSVLTIALLAWAVVCASSVAQDLQQVNVSVKIIEFQTDKNVETGLSAYFQHVAQEQDVYGHVIDAGRNATIESMDVSFPSSASALTVFVDRIHMGYGDLEIVLQGLVSQNRAFILSRPKAMVQVGQTVPTLIATTQDVPYEDTVVVGNIIYPTVAFRPTGVSFSVNALKVVDDDGIPRTLDDTYIQLKIVASVKERGASLKIASNLNVRGDLEDVEAPLFFNRMIDTTVWVRHGQVLILGGLYRNTKEKDLATLPWLTQTEDFTNSLIQRIIPFAVPQLPMAASVGNQKTGEGRRELVFLLKCELWRPSYTVADEFGFEEMGEEPEVEKKTATKVITNVIGGITDLPQDIVQGISGAEESVSSKLGAGNK